MDTGLFILGRTYHCNRLVNWTDTHKTRDMDRHALASCTLATVCTLGTVCTLATVGRDNH